MIGSRRIEELRAEAAYHRERYELYKAKTLGSSLTSETQLRELERRYSGADARLRDAHKQNARDEITPDLYIRR
jgi:hypothetical protein